MKWNKSLITSVFMAGLPVFATASPVTFNFAENNAFSTYGHTYTAIDGEGRVEVTPYSEYGNPYLISSVDTGLFIYTCIDALDCEPDNYQIDGVGPNEAAILDFGEMVDLVSVSFSYVGNDDNFTMLTGGVDDGVTTLADVSLSSGGILEFYDNGIATYTFADGVAGSEFAFLANQENDDFKLYSITADYVSNVPEPASLSLLGLGLMALGSIRKKAK